MKVLFVSTDFPYRSAAGDMTQGGGGACIAQLAGALDKKGLGVEVVTRSEPDLMSEIYKFPIHRTKYYNLGFRESKITHYFPATAEAKRLLKEKKFDIIHTHNPVAGLTGCKLARKYGVPHIMTLHGPWASVRQRFYTRALARHIEGKTVRGADLVTCDSQALADEILANYSPPRENIIAIPNAVDTGIFSPGASKEKARKELGINATGVLILYAGRFVEEKGLPYLLEAFKEIKGAHLLLLGGGFDEHLVKDWLARNAGMKERISVIPYLPYAKMPLAYSACDIFVLPTLAEGMSRSIMEAMACGLPVVATDVGGNPELVSAQTGMLVKPKDAEALRSRISKLVSDKKLRASMSAAARKKALASFSVEKRVSRFVKAYESLLK
jgi:glycosyltransferase involved in cell wall biosynthesis